jgi:hypothetical protein
VKGERLVPFSAIEKQPAFENQAEQSVLTCAAKWTTTKEQVCNLECIVRDRGHMVCSSLWLKYDSTTDTDAATHNDAAQSGHCAFAVNNGRTRPFEYFRDMCISSQVLTGISDNLPLGTDCRGDISMTRSFRSNTFNSTVLLSWREHLDHHSCRQEDRRCLAGLSLEETIEFEALEAMPPLDDNGNAGWTFEGEPTAPREKRWLELYRKHEEALELKRS